MRTWRTGRIGLTEADRLVAGDPPNSEFPGLGALLDAARAPASGEELAGERAAVAGFVAAYRGAVPAGVPKEQRREWVPLSARGVAVKVAAGVAVLAAGGTVLAAETGNLPAGMQRQAHSVFSSLGVPAPGPDGRPTDAGPAGVAGSVRPSTPATTGPGAGGTAPGPSDPATVALCQAWDAERKDPRSRAMTAQAHRALFTAAGGQSRVPAFCAGLLTPSPAQNPPAGATTAHPAPPTAAGSHPGGGNGNGGGHTPGNTFHPTPGPHR